ncbi:MAG: single-stranded DNA-binding protein [Planctomycetes bacterium]|nr:single-stranded DNA-binding protein [Planctomycetota bacterium]MCB9884953.1 single-stranded DNA-binding protein [Planctomycetota bacterium]
MSLVRSTQQIVRELEELRFAPPVACVYNPLEYAWDLHRDWLERFGRAPKEVVLVGMNPGPFGMVQTGVPFGEVEAVRSWLGIHGEVHTPTHQHPKRPVEGLACRRSEVSGRRLWGWAASRFVLPQRFARRFFVHNYCPLAFVGETGANLTPDKLPRNETEPLFRICDRFLRQVVTALQPKWVVGVGAFAEQRARAVLGDQVKIGRIPHPSPASPAANRGWEALADAAFADMGLATH